jgi:hypothetical protein
VISGFFLYFGFSGDGGRRCGAPAGIWIGRWLPDSGLVMNVLVMTEGERTSEGEKKREKFFLEK